MTGTTLVPAAPARAAAAAPIQRKRGRRGQNRLGETVQAYAFYIPIAVVFIVLFAVPFGQSVYYSFTDLAGLNPDADFVGFDNYARVFTDSSLLSGLIFTVLYAVATTLLITAVAIPLAVILNQKFFGRRLVRALYFFPAIPSIAILGLVWNFILNPLGSGALNTVLTGLFRSGPVPWLSDPDLARLCVILVGVWSSAGWHAILYLAYLQSIPSDYYEVARIDGASTWQQFRYITFPLLAPAVTISTLLLMTSGLNVFALPQTLTGGGPGYSTYTITQTIVTSGIAQGQYGQASALGVVFMIAVGLVVVAQLGLTRRLGKGS
ncbi:carbohydrate ABC transporter permease [Microbacterium sp. NPDC077663]|uniref:carbohydrate ABC transporter permease n=1 Tax=Microbacterium sp. NPDC077663 TaxID=3364189 RepID=UPI0037C7B98B